MAKVGASFFIHRGIKGNGEALGIFHVDGTKIRKRTIQELCRLLQVCRRRHGGFAGHNGQFLDGLQMGLMPGKHMGLDIGRKRLQLGHESDLQLFLLVLDLHRGEKERRKDDHHDQQII